MLGSNANCGNWEANGAVEILRHVALPNDARLPEELSNCRLQSIGGRESPKKYIRGYSSKETPLGPSMAGRPGAVERKASGL